MPDAEEPLPTPWDVSGPEGGTPALDADAVSAALSDLFANLYTYNADVLFLAYAEAMAWSDAECPPVESGKSGSMWDTVGCTSTEGAEYSGFVSAFIGEQGGEDVQVMRGEATMHLPDGSTLTLAGDASTHVNGLTWTTEVLGVMRYDGPAAAGSWVEAEPDLNLGYEISVANADGTFRSATFDGSISGLTGSLTAVAFNELTITDEGDCVDEPQGEIQVRDEEGVWASVTFGDDTCDGCAALVYEGTELGQVCVDPHLVIDAELPPW